MKISKYSVEKVLKSWLDSREKVVKKIDIVEFDCWIGGFVSGYSCADNTMTNADFDEIIKYLVTSPQAKRCGVTGTDKQIWEEYEIK